MTLRERIAELHAQGKSVKRIAALVDRFIKQVRDATWKMDNPERAKKNQQTYDATRYGTPEYRKEDREYKKRRYHTDPAYRQKRIDAALRYKERQRSGGTTS